MAPVAPVAPVAPTKATTPTRPATVRTASSATEAGAAAAGTAAVAPGTVGPAHPEAVQPAAATVRRVQKKAAEEEVINDGDKICGQCGRGNDEKRNFCRHCGASLREAAVYRLGFWARLRRRLFHRREHLAGARPASRRRAIGGSAPGWLTSWVTRVITIAVAVVALLSFVGPWHNRLHSREVQYYDDAVNLVHPTLSPLNPACPAQHPPGCPLTGALPNDASSAMPGHPASNAIDGALNTSWQSRGFTSGKTWLTVWFATPVHLGNVGFHIGDQDASGLYTSTARPLEMTLVFFNNKQTTAAANPADKSVVVALKTALLQDNPGFQTFDVDAVNCAGVTIYVDQVYPAPNPNVSIAEVEFKTKS